MLVQNMILLSVSPVFQMSREAGSSDTVMHLMEKTQIHEPFWYFIYLFILLGIYAWISIYYANVLVQTFQASANFKLTIRLFKDNSLLQNQLDSLLYLLYFMSLSFVLYYTELKTGLQPYALNGLLLFLFNLALLVLLFFGRVVIHRIAGFIFNRVKIIREYLYNVFVFNKLMGLAALPLMFLVVYTRGVLQDIMIWAGISAISGILLLRIFRGIVFSYQKGVLNFYMFLYLCALEIVPVVLIYRWLKGVL